MTSLHEYSIECSQTKCFGVDPHGLSKICSINVIIGKNNSGKSTLLDVLQYATRPESITLTGHRGHGPQVVLSYTVGDEHIAAIGSDVKHEKFGNARRMVSQFGRGNRVRFFIPAKGNISPLSTVGSPGTELEFAL